MSRRANFKYREMQFETLPCPLCGGDDFERLLEVDRYRMGVMTSGCQTCGLVMTNPIATEKDLQRFYATHYRDYYQSVERPDLAYIARYHKDERAAYTAEFLRSMQLLEPEAAVLDFGCAEGSLLKAMLDRQERLMATGIEPNPVFAEFAAGFTGARVYGSLEEMEASMPMVKFDLITINHVLEHLRNPVEFLSRLRDRLTPGGRLYIDVPALERYESIQSIHIAHLYHFSARTLEMACGRAGFRSVLLESHAPPHHPPSHRILLEIGSARSIADTDGDAEWYWGLVKGLKRGAWRFLVMRNRAVRIGLFLPQKLYRSMLRWIR